MNVTLKEKLYVAQPEDLEEKGFENYGYCLNNALYGLRQESREWDDHLNNFLLKMGCVRSEADPTLYLLKTGDDFAFLVVYVDDVCLLVLSSGWWTRWSRSFRRP